MAQGALPPPEGIVSKSISERILRWDEHAGRFEPMQRV